MPSLNGFQRSDCLTKLKSEVFDLVIVGGGITGAGVARDAASRGLRVAVIEAKDFSYGTSSRSSKLIHGGIRYLENLEFGLVFEALSERKILFEIAPHMVHPLKFVIPIYQSSRVGMFKMGLGMWLYDVLSLFDAPESHERWDEDQTMSRLPLLNPKALCGSYAYYDAYMDDDRLTLETLRSAQSLGAVCVNYARVIGRNHKADFTTGLLVRDEVSGEEFEVKGHHFVGSVGPWTDLFGKQTLSSWQKTLRPTKGVHITLDRNRLPLKEAIVMIDDEKNRIVFGIPRHEMIIIGTTDTDYPGDPSDVKTDPKDVEYLLEVAAEYFPGANLTSKDILASYSGVRPLVFDGAASEGKTSREHKIWGDPRNFTFVAGGKYTTYRHMAEQIVDFAIDALPEEVRARTGRSSTKEPLNPKASLASFSKARAVLDSGQWPLPSEEMRLLCERHGLEFLDVLKAGENRGFTSIWEYEALHAIRNTMCQHLDDFLIRRVPLFLATKDHGARFWPQILKVFSEELAWDKSREAAELNRVEQHLKSEMGWTSNFS